MNSQTADSRGDGLDGLLIQSQRELIAAQKGCIADLVSALEGLIGQADDGQLFSHRIKKAEVAIARARGVA